MSEYDPDVVGAQSTLAEWIGPYVADMLGKVWGLSESPYQAYGGQLTPEINANLQSAFEGIGSLGVPDATQDASMYMSNLADQMGRLDYNAQDYGNAYSSQGPYSSQYSAQGPYANQYMGQEGGYQNQYQAPENMYEAGDISTGMWNADYAQQYMNPYLQEALNPMMDEARRQAEVSRLGDASRLTQAGAYGGSRQAIMESELNRNLMDKQNQMLTQGYNTAYDRAMQGFTSDQARDLQAQIAQDRSRQVEGQQGLERAAQLAKYGLAADELSMKDRDLMAKYGLAADELGMKDRDLAAKYGLAADELGLKDRDLLAKYGLAADKLGQQDRQYEAAYGLDTLTSQLGAYDKAGQAGLRDLAAQMDLLDQQAQMGQLERAMEQEALSADYAQFQQERDYPYEQLKFMQSFLQGLPITARQTEFGDLTLLQEILGTTGGIEDILDILFGGGGSGGSTSGGGGTD